jgi:hypothetical protein
MNKFHKKENRIMAVAALYVMANLKQLNGMSTSAISGGYYNKVTRPGKKEV